MRKALWIAAVLLPAALAVGCGSSTVSAPEGKTEKGDAPAATFIPLAIHQGRDPRGPFEVRGFRPSLAKHLAAMKMGPDWWANIFTVRVDGKADVPPLLGDYGYAGDTLSFTPRYPLQRGVKYRAVVHPEAIPADEGEKYAAAELLLVLPKPETPPTVVEAVYPSRDELPENLLRFYVHFSAPMSRGDVYQYVHLLDAAGKPVEAPFLELEQELWDAGGERFTLLIHPGRIKRGLKPREDMGPALEQGKSYTLVIDRAWPDANGNALKEAHRKTFRAGPPDEAQPDPKTWKVGAPAAGQGDPLAVTFPKPLDHAMLERVLWVEDEKGQKVAGAVTVTDGETRWRFVPRGAWQAGAYNLVVDTALEDPAGNSVARPFEIDVFHPVETRVEAKTVKVPFVVK